MAGIGGINPLTPQGSLNRVRTHLVVAGNTALNATAGNMGKAQVRVQFEGPFTDQIPTATGIVNSKLPYVMGRFELSLLRSQLVGQNWLDQVTIDTEIGQVTIYSDSSTLSDITLEDVSIIEFDPGAFDGQDPIIRVTGRGVFYTNNVLWSTA